ncbi:acetyl-CoA C-acyltransferase [Streptomyces phyllanthi]|uniref:Probable acetyl-CoA acetyltransferase n=1 Tax=Streptomyces phyllanthi TaxID=1803180 RepID=A0A5N8VXM6_9ACTN|nr:acetyl-CoA C-acyltransferase [Streptomyces phyllanthi]MPY40013.1 acetyl-CoA C-acyltransferase [Streptomyces phyllanthi]
MKSLILGGARTPMGKLMGSLKDFSAPRLGSLAIREALARAGVRPEQVEYTIMGQAIGAGAGQNPARQAAVAAGIPMGAPAMTVNKVCLSGLDAVALADQLIRAGEFDLIVAGGQESMTRAPHLLAGARAGFKYGETALADSMELDGLYCSFDDMVMGEATERYNGRYGVTREEQDAFAAASHQKAAAAIASGALAEEIVPVPVPQRKGGEVLVEHDETVRPDTSVEILGKLRPSFGASGTITAGTSSPLNDGAAAVVVCSPRKAAELGLTPLAEIGAHGTVAGPDPSLHEQPANAINAALARAGLGIGDLDLVEINEAFASVGLVSAGKLGLSPEILNAEGGALALGHPLGASGARLVVHLAYALRRRGGGTAAAAMCGGGGQGSALLVHGVA